MTFYSSKSHRLKFLRSQCEQFAPALVEVWTCGDKFSRRCFELLGQAYVNARYSPHFEITPDEVGWIGKRVALLQHLVDTICHHLRNQRCTS